MYPHATLCSIARKMGFEAVASRRVSGSYTGEEARSMKPEYYDVPLTVFRLNPEVKVDGGHDASNSSSRGRECEEAAVGGERGDEGSKSGGIFSGWTVPDFFLT